MRWSVKLVSSTHTCSQTTASWLVISPSKVIQAIGSSCQQFVEGGLEGGHCQIHCACVQSISYLHDLHYWSQVEKDLCRRATFVRPFLRVYPTSALFWRKHSAVSGFPRPEGGERAIEKMQNISVMFGITSKKTRQYHTKCSALTAVVPFSVSTQLTPSEQAC